MKFEQRLGLIKLHVADCKRLGNAHYVAETNEMELFVQCAQFLSNAMVELKRIRVSTGCEKTRTQLQELSKRYETFIKSSLEPRTPNSDPNKDGA